MTINNQNLFCCCEMNDRGMGKRFVNKLSNDDCPHQIDVTEEAVDDKSNDEEQNDVSKMFSYVKLNILLFESSKNYNKELTQHV